MRGQTGLDDNETAEKWTVVATVPDIPINGLQEVHFGRHIILLVNFANEIRAFQGLCPHQLAHLAEGMLVDDMIQCPRHLARFSLVDGSCSGGWQLAPLKRYEVRIEDGNILLRGTLVALE